MQIHQATIYKFSKKDKFLIHSVSRTAAGPSIASPPFLWLDGNCSLLEVAEQMKNALSQSKSGLVTPNDWKKNKKEFFENVGLKNSSDLYKESKQILIHTKNNTMFLTPMVNEGKGFANNSLGNIAIPESSSIEEISLAIEEAFIISK